MIRHREFSIRTASLAGLSLLGACAPTNVNGEWNGSAYILAGGTTYDLPFSFEGSVSYAGWFGTTILDYEEWTMDFALTVDKDTAKLTREQHKVYTYTYDYGEGYAPYVATVDWQTERTYGGTVTHVGPRQFDIVLDLDKDEQVLVVNGEPVVDEEKESPTTQSAVLECGTDGVELHCFQGGNLILFTE